MKKAVFLAVCFIIAAAMPAGIARADVWINEVMPHTNNNLGAEWIELYNNGTETISIVNWILADKSFTANDTISLILTAENFSLIVDNDVVFGTKNGCEAVYDFLNDTSFSCVEIPAIGNGLLDTGDGVYLFNGSFLVSNFSWASSITSNGKSWSYEDSFWQQCTPTPGALNNCNVACIQNWSCTSWSSCSGGTQTKTCTDLNSCGNATGKPAESQICTSDDDIYITLDWDEDDIVNGEEFEITVKAYNLEGDDYDIKVEIQDEDGDTISETYGNHGEDNNNWETSKNYILEFFSGSGDKDDEIKLRIKSSYDDFSGDATIYAKIRENGKSSVIDEWEDDIEILAAEDDSESSSGNSASSDSSDSSDSGAIELGAGSSSITGAAVGADAEGSIIYKSRNEYIKEYAVYGFSLLCVGLIILLLIDKG